MSNNANNRSNTHGLRNQPRSDLSRSRFNAAYQGLEGQPADSSQSVTHDPPSASQLTRATTPAATNQDPAPEAELALLFIDDAVWQNHEFIIVGLSDSFDQLHQKAVGVVGRRGLDLGALVVDWDAVHRHGLFPRSTPLTAENTRAVLLYLSRRVAVDVIKCIAA